MITFSLAFTSTWDGTLCFTVPWTGELHREYQARAVSGVECHEGNEPNKVN